MVVFLYCFERDWVSLVLMIITFISWFIEYRCISIIILWFDFFYSIEYTCNIFICFVGFTAILGVWLRFHIMRYVEKHTILGVEKGHNLCGLSQLCWISITSCSLLRTKSVQHIWPNVKYVMFIDLYLQRVISLKNPNF